MELLNPDFGERILASLPEAGEWNNTPEGRIEMLANSYLDARANRWAIQGARHGIAFVHPLVDRRILEFTLSLPLERFLDKGYSRQPFRNAMEGILPDSIRWRTSKFSPFPDLPLNLAASARGLKARVDRLRDHPGVRELFNLDAVATAFQRAGGRQGDAAGLPDLGQGTPPGWFLAGFRALTALSLAEHVERYS
jgi:asparagine synthase (glutamine-hydrolysing)